MVQQETSNRVLETFAHSAALSLNVPFVTIALNADSGDLANGEYAHKAVFVEGSWATAHADIDLAALDNASAVAQRIPFFACVPIRSDAGETLGTLCCGDSDERDLSDTEVSALKAVAAQVAAHIGVAGKATISARG